MAIDARFRIVLYERKMNKKKKNAYQVVRSRFASGHANRILLDAANFERVREGSGTIVARDSGTR